MPTFLPLRAFGKTSLRVTPLCIGCAPLGNMPETFAYDVAETRALETLRAFFQAPINFLDTAASYGDGESERAQSTKSPAAERRPQRIKSRMGNGA